MHGNPWNVSLKKTLSILLLLSCCQLTLLAAEATNWVAFNDHASGTGTGPNATAYSITTSVGAGGLLKNVVTGETITGDVGVSIVPCCGTIDGVTGSSTAPYADTPATNIFAGQIAWADSAIYFGDSPYTASITFTFTNLDPAKRYVFRGTAVRGNGYSQRWTMATITGIQDAIPAHIQGSGSPGIVTNGWVPFGTNMIAGRQAGWNSGENRCGDVIGWDNIVPDGNSFSVICSNHAASTLYVPAVGGGATTINKYCYAFAAIMLAEIGEAAPVGITQEPPAETLVEEYETLNLSLTATGSYPRYLWYQGDLGSGTLVAASASPAYVKTPAQLADTGNYYCVVTNEANAVTSTLAHVTVFVNSIVITQQPPAVTSVVETRSFSLGVGVTGTRPQYQWYRKEGDVLTAIEGATSATYTEVAGQVTADTTSYYVVVVTNSLYNVTSEVAQVTILNDEVPPEVVRVVASPGFDRFVIEFNEPVDTASAEDQFSYNVDPYIVWGQGVLTNGSKSVVLPTDPQTPNTDYTVTVDYVTDLAGNTVVMTNVVVRTWVTNLAGGLVFEKYDVGGGNYMTNLTDNPKYPDNPDAIYGVGAFNPTNVFTMDDDEAIRNNYGGRVRGWFLPPYTAQWRFFMSADDAAEFWFNPAGPDPAGKSRVAFVPDGDCCDPFQEPPNDRTSEPFSLVAGQPYYVEGIYKEGAGGDYLVVAARLEGDSTAASTLQWIGGDIGYPGIPPGLAGTFAITTQPASVTVEDPNPASFSVEASSSTGAPIAYQWQRNDGFGTFTNLPGATTRTYELAVTEITLDDNAQFRCVAAAADVQLISDVATLDVTADATGPLMLTGVPDATFTNITVNFSEELDPTGAGNSANYSICEAFNAAACINLIAAYMTNNNTAVVLQADSQVVGSVFRLTANNNVTDVAGNPVRPPQSVIVAAQLTFQDGDANGYTGTQDAEIHSATPASTLGTATSISVDNEDAGGRSQGLIQFADIFGGGANQIPLGADIASATLIIRTIDPTDAGSGPELHRMLVPWDQATVTWNSLVAGVTADDMEAVATRDVQFEGSTDEADVLIDVTTALQAWSDGQANYGWAIFANANNGWDWAASEYTTAQANRPKLSVLYTPSAATNEVEIVTQPAPSTTVEEGDSFTLSVVVRGTLPAFQWYKGSDPIPGAESSTYTVTGAIETDSGTYYCVITNFYPSSVTSDAAVVTVNPDTNGPVLVGGLGTSDTTIVLTFDQAVDGTSVSNLLNYTVAPAFGGTALTIVDAALSADGTTVTLTTGARDTWTYYTLTVQNITDTAYRLNLIAPNPTSIFLPFQVSLLAPTGTWKYNDLGMDLGAEWIATGYDDTAWASGAALLYAARFNNTPSADDCDVPPTTMMAWTNSSLATNITYYLRTWFPMPAAAELANLQTFQLRMRPIIDDGAAFYLNGQEIRRVGMADGAITWSTFASRTGGSSYRFEGPYDLSTTNVVFGANNLIAAEVHQVNLTSSDLAFAAELEIYVPGLSMEITIERSGGNVMLSWPAVPGYRLYAADDVAGPYEPVLDGGNPVTTPYTVPAPLADKKFYQLQNP
ncbi:MAG: immunoglobulin domain-containing protein [Verrucomicrobia bacterium]|nr:immunoglobulin domain-containing protein [Verrucomicrobiota bacterium]